MKKIFYYITDHGKGHATRSIAIIKELEKNFEVIIRNSNAEDLIKKSLPKIQIIKGKTDQGSIIKNDGVSINKSKTKKEGAVTFSTILQVLDGIQSPENVIFMLTTNHPTSLDSALYRDGRINKIVEIGYPRYTDIIDFINSYYDLQLSLADVFPKVDGDTCIKTGMSTIEQYCLESYDIDTLLTRLKKEKI